MVTLKRQIPKCGKGGVKKVSKKIVGRESRARMITNSNHAHLAKVLSC